MDERIEKLRGKLIVSCRVLPHESTAFFIYYGAHGKKQPRRVEHRHPRKHQEKTLQK